MKITEVKVFLVKNEERDKRLKAYATIVFDDCFIVRDLKIILGNGGGFFVSMPSRRFKEGTFRDIAHPLNAQTRNDIERAVLAEYEKCAALPAGSQKDAGSYDMD
mgnify:CR=1 FL=1